MAKLGKDIPLSSVRELAGMLADENGHNRMNPVTDCRFAIWAVLLRKETVQLRFCEGLIKIAEGPPFPRFAPSIDQTCHGGTIKRCPETDPLDASGRQFGDRKRPPFDSNHEIDRLGYGSAYRVYRRKIRQSRRE